MKVLVFGANGQAGTEFCDLASANNAMVIPLTRADLDVDFPGKAAAMINSTRADVVVNLTAFHVLERCEIEFDRAIKTNVLAVREMAAAVRDTGGWFVTVSTDYAFDGAARSPYAENAPVGPLQAYGISKVAGEFSALSVLPERAIVVRTCGLYGRGVSQKGGNFVDKRLEDARRLATLEVGCDLTCNPTSAASFAAGLWRLLIHEQREAGLYHLAAEGACNWAEFTAAIFEIAGMRARVVPIDRHGHYGLVRRPAYSVLGNTRARSLGITMPTWREQLVAYLGRSDAMPHAAI